jgi:hypothetical protein
MSVELSPNVIYTYELKNTQVKTFTTEKKLPIKPQWWKLVIVGTVAIKSLILSVLYAWLIGAVLLHSKLFSQMTYKNVVFTKDIFLM